MREDREGIPRMGHKRGGRQVRAYVQALKESQSRGETFWESPIARRARPEDWRPAQESDVYERNIAAFQDNVAVSNLYSKGHQENTQEESEKRAQRALRFGTFTDPDDPCGVMPDMTDEILKSRIAKFGLDLEPIGSEEAQPVPVPHSSDT